MPETAPATPPATLTRASMRALTTDIMAAVAAVTTRHGVTLTQGPASFAADGTSGSVKLAISAPLPAGTKSVAAVDFERHCSAYGFAPTDLGRAFTQNWHRYVITGLRMGSRTTPILARNAGTDRDYAFPAPTVALLLTLER